MTFQDEERRLSSGPPSSGPAVLISVRPEWCAKLITGEKTIELRKSAPKIPVPFDVFMYCTKGGRELTIQTAQGTFPVNGTVFAMFHCSDILVDHAGEYAGLFAALACVPPAAQKEYGRGKEIYGWDFSTPYDCFPQPMALSDFVGLNGAPIIRAPQSWCYCQHPYQ